MIINTPVYIRKQILEAREIWLFLDYDGTLSEFAPTPDHILPNPEIINLINNLVQQPDIRVSVLSGRRLSHIRQLLPIPNIILAGSYGIEYQTPNGSLINRLDLQTFRPILDEIKIKWQDLISNNSGFYLEDKGWSIAIHASKVEDSIAMPILDEARLFAEKFVNPNQFRVLGGFKFLEIGPKIANKGTTVEYFLRKYPLNSSLLIYLGDDDKDEEAFAAIQKHKGIAIVVTSKSRQTLADMSLDSPATVRQWLMELLAERNP